MLRVNLYVGKKPFKMPVIAGVDTGAISFKGLALAWLISFAPDFVFKEEWQQEMDSTTTINKQLQLKLKKLQKEERGYGQIQAEIEELKKQEKRLARRLGQVKILIKQKINPMKVLLYFAKNIPEDVWLENLNMTGSKISVKGRSSSYKSIGVLIENLKSSVFFDATLKLQKSETITDPVTSKRIESFELTGRVINFG